MTMKAFFLFQTRTENINFPVSNSWSNDVFKQRYFNVYNVYKTLFQRRLTHWVVCKY